MLQLNRKNYVVRLILFLVGISFVLTLLILDISFAASRMRRIPSDRTSLRENTKLERKKLDKNKDKQKKKDEIEEETSLKDESLFLPEAAESQDYLPEIYRCLECGYEQDEPGYCPDHEKNPLVLVISKGKNPLVPPEVDGNEDLIVDIPLTNIQFKKTRVIATETPNIQQNSSSNQP